MNLYKIEQDVNNGYDTYDSAVVCAENEESARKIHPSKYSEDNWYDEDGCWDSWAWIEDIIVTLIGVAESTIKPGIICASFNAG